MTGVLTGVLTGDLTGQRGLIKRGQIYHTPDVSIVPLKYLQIALFSGSMLVLCEMYVAGVKQRVHVLLVGMVVDGVLVAGEGVLVRVSE